QVVGGELDQHLVAGEDADAVLAHLAGGMAEDLVAVLQLHAEHRVGQQLDDLPAHFEKFFLGHSHPCKKSAALNRSTVKWKVQAAAARPVSSQFSLARSGSRAAGSGRIVGGEKALHVLEELDPVILEREVVGVSRLLDVDEVDA